MNFILGEVCLPRNGQRGSPPTVQRLGVWSCKNGSARPTLRHTHRLSVLQLL